MRERLRAAPIGWRGAATAGDPGGLRVSQGAASELAGGWGELGGVEVDAGAAGGGVEEEAGGGARVVGDAGAVVEG